MAISIKKGGSTSRPVTLPMVVAIRFDQATTDKLEAIAFDRGISISDTVRSMVQQLIDHPAPVPLQRRHVPDGDVLRDILANLGKIGSNINQIAHVANATKVIDLDGLEYALRELRMIAAAIRAVAGGTDDP